MNQVTENSARNLKRPLNSNNSNDILLKKVIFDVKNKYKTIRYNQKDNILIVDNLLSTENKDPDSLKGEETTNEFDENKLDSNEFDYHILKFVKRGEDIVKVFECSICNKEFPYKYTLMRHIPVHTDERNYKCDDCGSAFRQLSTLNQHRVIHSIVRPHECDICHKKFNRVSTLISHHKIHTDDKQFSCPICDKSFHQKGNLINHMHIHNNTRPYICLICQKGFNQMSNLSCHMRKVHQKYFNNSLNCFHCAKEYAKRFSKVLNDLEENQIFDEKTKETSFSSLNNIFMEKSMSPNSSSAASTQNFPTFEHICKVATLKSAYKKCKTENLPSFNSLQMLQEHILKTGDNIKQQELSPQLTLSLLPPLEPPTLVESSTICVYHLVVRKQFSIKIPTIETDGMHKIKLQGSLPFAILHLCNGQTILMRIIEKYDGNYEHTLRLINNEDIQLLFYLQNDRKLLPVYNNTGRPNFRPRRRYYRHFNYQYHNDYYYDEEMWEQPFYNVQIPIVAEIYQTLDSNGIFSFNYTPATNNIYQYPEFDNLFYATWIDILSNSADLNEIEIVNAMLDQETADTIFDNKLMVTPTPVNVQIEEEPIIFDIVTYTDNVNEINSSLDDMRFLFDESTQFQEAEIATETETEREDSMPKFSPPPAAHVEEDEINVDGIVWPAVLVDTTSDFMEYIDQQYMYHSDFYDF